MLQYVESVITTRCESLHDTSSSPSRHVEKMDDIGDDASKRQYQGHPDARKRRLLALSKTDFKH